MPEARDRLLVALDVPGLADATALLDRLPKKELAVHLNLSPETLSRLKRQGKI